MVIRDISFDIAGRLPIGGGAPIIVQTMCNTSTDDIEGSLAQCRAMAAAGAGLIRLTTQGLKQVESLRIIRERLRAEGIMTPLVADIHFLADAALAASIFHSGEIPIPSLKQELRKQNIPVRL